MVLGKHCYCSIGSAVLYEGLVLRMYGSSIQFWHFPVYGENAYVLEGRHGGSIPARIHQTAGGEFLHLCQHQGRN